MLAFGCGSSRGGGAGFGPDDGGTTGPALDDAGSDGGSSATLTFLDSGSSALVFTSQDAGPQMVTFQCQPGTYAGMFTTTVTTDAGLFPSLLHFDWSGTLTITLQGHVVQTHSSNGETFSPAPVLTIAPGAMLSGADNFGGHFTSGLSGQLDCPTKKLTGTLSNGVYEYPGDAGNIPMQGSLTAVYQGTPAPPSLTMGTIAVSSPTYSTLAANGMWSATHQ
jgi:hypothetical protein